MDIMQNDDATVTGAESVADQQSDDDLLIGVLTATDDEDQRSDEAQDELFTVIIDEEEKQVTKSELISEYQKKVAAGKKFDEAAAIRREADKISLEAKENKDKYIQHQQQLADHLQQLDQHIQLWSQEEQPDWNRLLEENPHEYLKQQEKYKARIQTLQQAQAAKSYLEQQQQQEHIAEISRVVDEEKQKLPTIIPEWKNKTIREREEKELVSYLSSIGYSDDDIVGLSYSRASNISIARKAMLYDRAMKQAKGLKKDDGAATVVPTLGSKSSAQGKRSIDDPNLSPDDFAKLRREQISKRR